MLSCVIIDDEQFSIDAIKRYIDMLPNLNIAGIYTDPQTALEDFSTKSYVDVLFMDIDMPLISGLELAKVLRPQTRKLIFTTSHSKYAFDAFEVDGDAFLLKPFSFLKFSTVVNRLFQNEQLDKVKSMGTNSDYFLVKNKEEDLRILKIKFNEVIAFESFNNYVKIYLTTEKVVDLGPLKIDKEKNHPVQWSPIIGGILLVGGIILIATNKDGK